ncbi:hypothetical protein DYB32_006549 [Aphanomyces invadans]|uniref:Uncharacterized protein n=1 Tax=Aphanomyces invadans TaxID=157072 RepID=A0A3R7CY03_9STRA|nr:hypothetical protein DYB32_006549 [Aphanomyces invadans]
MEDSNVPPTQAGAIYRLQADILVKETVNGWDKNGEKLPPQIFEGISWNSIKQRIFDLAVPRILGIATYVPNPRKWSVAPGPPTIEDFNKFITIRMGRNQFKPTSIEHAHQYLTDHSSKNFTIAILKWGDFVNTAADLNEFRTQCIAPSVQDRAGAAAESEQQAMVESLKAQWGDTYEAYDATWRMRAVKILKRPNFQHDALIRRPPPVNMIQLFHPVSNAAEVRIERIQISVKLARDVTVSCLKDLVKIKNSATALALHVESCIQMLEDKKEMIESFHREVDATTDNEDLQHVLDVVPNVEDLDHA